MSEAAFERKARRIPVSTNRKGGRLFLFAGAFFLGGLAIYIALAMIVLPWFRISRIHVHADFEIAEHVLLEQAGLTGTAYFFLVKPADVAQRLEQLPIVRSASVERAFPDALRLELLRRRPIAIAIINRNGRDLPAVIDEEGVMYDAGPHLADLDLPVISGVEFHGDPIGSRMPETFESLLTSLYRLRIDEPRLFDQLSELKVVPRRNGGFDVLLYTAGYRIPVRLGSEISAELCRWSLMVLDVLSRQGFSDQVLEVDFRSGEIVYRMKEDSNGR